MDHRREFIGGNNAAAWKCPGATTSGRRHSTSARGKHSTSSGRETCGGEHSKSSGGSRCGCSEGADGENGNCNQAGNPACPYPQD